MRSKDRLLLPLFFLAMSASASISRADQSDARTYGALYLEDEQSIETKGWEFGLNYETQFNNPYLVIQGLSLTVLRTLGTKGILRFIRIGVSYEHFFTSPNATLPAFSRQLSAQTQVVVDEPHSSLLGVLDLIPVQGNIALFSNEAAHLAVGTRLEAGRVFYQPGKNQLALNWSIRPSLLLSDAWGVEFAFGESIEAPFSASDRSGSWYGQTGLIFKL